MITKNMLLYILGIFVAIMLVQPSSFAQTWRFPNCDDLEVTNIDLNTDNLVGSIRIYNHCDSCAQHVYTGIILYANKDTLALSKWLYSNQSPDNHSTETYDLQMRKAFTQNDITRIQMVAGLCDSIPYMAVKNENVTMVSGVRVYPNPAKNRIYFDGKMEEKVKSAILFNTLGEKVLQVMNPTSPLNCDKIPDGVYFIRFTTHKGNHLQQIILHK